MLNLNQIKYKEIHAPYICPLCGKWSCSLVRECEKCNAHIDITQSESDEFCTKFGIADVEKVECRCDKNKVKEKFQEYLIQNMLNSYQTQINDLRNRLKWINLAVTGLLTCDPVAPMNTNVLEYIEERSKI